MPTHTHTPPLHVHMYTCRFVLLLRVCLHICTLHFGIFWKIKDLGRGQSGLSGGPAAARFGQDFQLSILSSMPKCLEVAAGVGCPA